MVQRRLFEPILQICVLLKCVLHCKLPFVQEAYEQLQRWAAALGFYTFVMA